MVCHPRDSRARRPNISDLMIIPNEVAPSWTNADARDANLYSIHRQRLWYCNYCVSVWPQIFSWIVVNIYPASSEHDYRFEPAFANRAILVTVDWHSSGKGCRNSKCYATYPPGNRCTIAESPIVFPSGNKSAVVACQPACYARQRTRLLMKTSDQNVSLTDQKNPAQTCVDCHYLNERAAYTSRRWRFGNDRNRIDLFDSRSGKLVDVQHEMLGRTPAERDENGSVKLKVDAFNVEWDDKYDNCIVVNDYVFRTVVEPLYRDPSAICKLTNFEIGDDVEWGFRYRESSSRVVPNYGFLVKHSTGYCRAFAKDLTAEGECKQPWWQNVLANTVAGDGIIHAIHSLVHYDPNCVQTWKVDEGDRQQVSQVFSTNSVYDLWRRDVNVDLTLPPPNVTLLDLGIDVSQTGNRLYWNSAEGVLSQFALFRSVTNRGPLPFADSTQEKFKRFHRGPTSIDTLENDRVDVDKKRPKYQRYATKPRLRWGRSRQRRALPLRDNEEKRTALLEYHDLLADKTARLRKRAADLPHGAVLAPDKVRDGDIDRPLETLWRERVRPVISEAMSEATSETQDAADELARYTREGSVSYTLETHELAAQRYVESRLQDDSIRPERPAKQERLLIPATARSATWRSGERDDDDLNDLLQHIQEEIEHGEASTLLQDLGLAVGYEVADRLLRKSLKFAFAKIGQVLSRHTAGVTSMALMKIGMRVGLSKMFGSVAARLTARLMVLVGQAASVVGLIVDSISLVSLLFDIAELAGWDPGSFRNEQDLRFYYDMAVYFVETLTDTQRGPISPLEMMLIFTTADDTASEGSQKSGTSETAVNDFVDNSGTNQESGSTKALHIDERLRYPKWFNRKFTSCFATSSFSVFTGVVLDLPPGPVDSEHVAIQDTSEVWGLVTCMDYLGGLTTNSFGQKIVKDPVDVRLRDEDLSSLVTEIEYRDLLTISSRAAVDSTSFNRRVGASERVQNIGLVVAVLASGGTVLSLLASTFYGSSTPPLIFSLLDFNLVALLTIFCTVVLFVYTSIEFVPVPAKTDTEPDSTKRDMLHYYVDSLRSFATGL